jgi:Tol biopolymer transport system component
VNNRTYPGSLRRRVRSSIFRVLVVAGTVSGLGCAGVKPHSSTGSGGSSGSTGTGLSSGSGGSGVVMPTACNGLCTDFPSDPINTNIPAIDPGMFGTPSGAGPCVTEPEDGSLFPNNWLRPRIRVPGASTLKITIHADLEANDLVAYASGESWSMPKDVWTALASHVVEQPISVTVQLPSGGATTVKFEVAAVGAGGSMVFWAANPGAANKMGVESDPVAQIMNDSDLQGFSVGDDKTIEALNIVNVQQQVFQQDGQNTRGSHCIGCHSGTPDGDYVAFVDAWPWPTAFANIQAGTTGAALPGYTGATCTGSCTGSKTFAQYPWGGPLAFSAAHWKVGGDRIAIMASQLAMTDLATPWNTDDKLPGNLVWIDTENTQTQVNAANSQVTPVPGSSFGYLAHTGDLGGAAFPTWSADGNTIVYASSVGANGDLDGRLNQGTTDLYSIPYNNRAGGAATPVPGASTTGLEEYYPAFSPDDKFVAFTAVPAGQVMYANPNAELYVVPFNRPGAQAVKLAANTPPICTRMLSPGINNHWPKWSPDAATANGKTYYWMIFSSNRYGLAAQKDAVGNPVQVSQLYITAVVTDEITTTTYPAIYLWNQSTATLNTTPAWQNFNIPIIID